MGDSNYFPIDPVDIALEHKTYTVIHDPSGDFIAGARIGGNELAIMLSAGYLLPGAELHNNKNKKTYVIVRTRGRLIKKDKEKMKEWIAEHKDEIVHMAAEHIKMSEVLGECDALMSHIKNSQLVTEGTNTVYTTHFSKVMIDALAKKIREALKGGE